MGSKRFDSWMLNFYEMLIVLRGIAFIWKCNWHVAFILIFLD